MNKKISVALATYNGEKFILQQLDSLRNQTYSINEVIIVDDCSTDQTQYLIINYIHEYNLNWKLYINKENLGYKKNFKEVLKKITGDFIFLCDQDDIWESNKVEQIVQCFQDSHVKCVNTAFTCINEKNEVIESFSFYKKQIDIEQMQCVPFEEIIISNIAMGCTMAFTKDIKDLYLQYSNGIAAHDWEINCIASLFDGLFYYNKPLIRYRIHQNNTTGIDTFNKGISKKQQRIKNCLEIDQLLNCMIHYKQYMNESYIATLNQCIQFSKNRILLLSNNQREKWFSLLKDYKLYRKYVSIKGILFDLL